MNNFEINSLIETLKSNNILDRKERKEHIKSIHKKIVKESLLMNHETCPRCGSVLVKRTGKYGNFIGCSNYPNCKFIKK